MKIKRKPRPKRTTITLSRRAYHALVDERDQLASCLLCHQAALNLVRDQVRELNAKIAKGKLDTGE